MQANHSRGLPSMALPFLWALNLSYFSRFCRTPSQSLSTRTTVHLFYTHTSRFIAPRSHWTVSPHVSTLTATRWSLTTSTGTPRLLPPSHPPSLTWPPTSSIDSNSPFLCLTASPWSFLLPSCFKPNGSPLPFSLPQSLPFAPPSFLFLRLLLCIHKPCLVLHFSLS